MVQKNIDPPAGEEEDMEEDMVIIEDKQEDMERKKKNTMGMRTIEEQNIGVEQEDIEDRTEKKGIEVQPEQKQTSTIETENMKPTKVEDQYQEGE